MKRIDEAEPAVPTTRPLLEVRDLELVVAIAAAKTTAAAARSLHITQSAVSRALTTAEERLGVRLFERSVRGLTPTAAGERLIAGAGSLIAELKALEHTVTAPASTPSRLRLVCECYTAYRWLPSTMAALTRRLPGVTLEILVQHTGDPLSALLKGKIDVALFTTSSVPPKYGARFVERPLFSDELVFLVAPSHPLACRRTLDRADLRAHQLITPTAPVAERRWFLTSVFGRRHSRVEFLALPLTEAIIDATRAGMGIGVLSEWMARPYVGEGDLLVKRLASGPLRRPWRIAHRLEVSSYIGPLVAALAADAPRLPEPPPP